MRELSSVLIVFISSHEVLTSGDASNLDEPCTIRIVVDQSCVIEKVLVDLQNNTGNRREYISYSFYGLNIAERLACNYLIIYLREVNEYEIAELALSIISDSYISLVSFETNPFIILCVLKFFFGIK